MAINQEVLGILVRLEGKTAFIAGVKEETAAMGEYTAAQHKAAAASDMQAAASKRQADAALLVHRMIQGLVLATGGLVVEAVKAAVKWEDMGKKVSQQTGLVGTDLERMMGTIQRTAEHAPYAINEIADAAVLLKTRFGMTDEQIEHTSGLMVAFAKRVGGSAKDVTTSLMSILQQYRQPLGTVVSLTDKLTALTHATQKPLDQVLGTIEKYGPKLQAMGFDLNQSLTLLGLFQASGLTTSMMGRGLSASLTKAMKEGEKTGEPIPNIINRHVSEIKNATSQTEAYTLAIKFFGAQVGPTFARALFRNAEAFKLVEEAMGKSGGTMMLFTAQQKSVTGRWQELRNQTFFWLKEMGDEILPMLKDAMKTFKDVASGILENTNHGKDLVPVLLSLIGLWTAYKIAMVGYAVWQAVATGITLVKNSLILLRLQLMALAVWEGVTAFAATVVAADSTIIVANLAAGRSFLALLGPIGLAAAAAYALNQILPPGDKIENLLGGNQPNEKTQEYQGQDQFIHWSHARRLAWYEAHHIPKNRRPPGFGEGGVVTLGESGPETVWLPHGANVQPSPSSSLAVPRAHTPTPTPAGDDRTHHSLEAVLVMPDGRVLASLVTKELALKRSRK